MLTQRIRPRLSSGRRSSLPMALCMALFVSLLVPIAFASPASAALPCPCTIWAPTATPANPAEADTDAVEVGTKFRSDISGFVTGVRFYKGVGNSGTHVGNLWTTAGANLGTVTFTGETA